MPIDEKTEKRVAKALDTIKQIRLKLLAKRAAGLSFWYGPEAEFQNIDDRDLPSQN